MKTPQLELFVYSLDVLGAPNSASCLIGKKKTCKNNQKKKASGDFSESLLRKNPLGLKIAVLEYYNRYIQYRLMY